MKLCPANIRRLIFLHRWIGTFRGITCMINKLILLLIICCRFIFMDYRINEIHKNRVYKNLNESKMSVFMCFLELDSQWWDVPSDVPSERNSWNSFDNNNFAVCSQNMNTYIVWIQCMKLKLWPLRFDRIYPGRTKSGH